MPQRFVQDTLKRLEDERQCRLPLALKARREPTLELIRHRHAGDDRPDLQKSQLESYFAVDEESTTMTTASPTDPTVRYGDRITRRASSARPAGQTDWSERNGVVELIGDHASHLAKEIGDHVADLETDLQRKIKALELGLALANGKLTILSGAGVPGCFNVRGTHDARSTYNYLDVVAYNGASWVAKKDNPGELPGPGWQLLAAQGSRGGRGERGERGPPGPAPVLMGARFSHRGMEIETTSGPPIPLFKSVAVDPETFVIKITGSNDSVLTINLLPLFQSFHAQTTSR
jgi:hypothetical protein